MRAGRYCAPARVTENSTSHTTSHGATILLSPLPFAFAAPEQGSADTRARADAKDVQEAPWRLKGWFPWMPSMDASSR